MLHASCFSLTPTNRSHPAISTAPRIRLSPPVQCQYHHLPCHLHLQISLFSCFRRGSLFFFSFLFFLTLCLCHCHEFFFRLRLLFITGSLHASACFDDALLTHPLPVPSRPIPPTNADAALLPPRIRLPPRPQPPRTNKRTNERTTERQHTRTGPGWAELGLAGPGLGQWMVKSGTPVVVVGCRFVNMCVPGHPDRPPTANECMPCTHASMYGCYLPTTQCIFFGGASAPACGLRPRA